MICSPHRYVLHDHPRNVLEQLWKGFVDRMWIGALVRLSTMLVVYTMRCGRLFISISAMVRNWSGTSSVRGREGSGHYVNKVCLNFCYNTLRIDRRLCCDSPIIKMMMLMDACSQE